MSREVEGGQTRQGREYKVTLFVDESAEYERVRDTLQSLPDINVDVINFSSNSLGALPFLRYDGIPFYGIDGIKYFLEKVREGHL